MDVATFTPSSAPGIEKPAPSPDPVAPAQPDVPAAGAPHGGRIARLWRGHASDPTWARPAIITLLFATAAFYLVGLTANGYANSFYSAAAQAGSASWKAFFYGSFDASNAITVDKPPASLWVMALSVRLFGLNSFAMLFPEVLMGVASVGVVYAAVRRYWNAAAGLLAGVVLALTPVAVLMFRFNNPDALLTLLMALAAYATLRAIEHGSTRWFVAAGVALGFGFLTKALQVLLVVPALGLAFLLFANAPLRRRIAGALAGTLALLLSAGWWVAVVELVPADMRPYIGGSQTNSFLELTFGYNGLGRLNGSETGSVGGGQRGPNSGTESVWRMFSSSVGGQISWLIPAALILLLAGIAMRGRAPRTDLRRAAYVVWGGWLLVTMTVFSMMAGIFHEYYTVALAPAVAAIVGMGAAEAWERRDSVVGGAILAAATAAAAGWSFVLLSRSTAYGNWLRVSVLVPGIAAALLFLVVARLATRAIPVVAAAGIVAALAGPAAYSITTVTTAHTGSIVTAGPASGGGFGGMRGGPGGFPGGTTRGGAGSTRGGAGSTLPGGGAANGLPTMPGGTTGTRGGMGGLLNSSLPSTEVVAALSADAQKYTWVAAAVGSQNAAGLQLGTQLPVMAIGGFNGSDPSPTLAQFQADVQAGEIHYFLAGGGFGQQNGGSDASSQINSWVAANYTSVQIGGQTFYDLTAPLSGTTPTN
ncbi:MAG: glycosyltransferase family 39 protein [Dermatophilaceae bacterium]